MNESHGKVVEILLELGDELPKERRSLHKSPVAIRLVGIVFCWLEKNNHKKTE